MKLTEKELNKFPIGTKIIYQGKEVMKTEMAQNKYSNIYYNTKTYIWYDTEQLLTTENLIEKVEIPTYTEYIPPKPILDDREKEYLSAVIRPWRDRVTYIAKEEFDDLDCNTVKEFVAIYCEDSLDSFDLPSFEKGTMYKGMELDKEYSLEELGL